MTQPTKAAELPDVLRPIQRYKIGYHSDEWGMRSLSPTSIYDDAGPWVRYEDHVTALAAGRATAAPAQPAAQQGAAYAALPEKYYLAGGEVPTWDAKQMHAFADATHALRTTHVQNPAEIEHVAGDVSKNGAESDMAQQPAPTAQADSQLAPEYVGNGMFKGETIQKAAEHWANWCDVRCMTGLSEFLRVVAAHAPTDSVTAPGGEGEGVAGPGGKCMGPRCMASTENGYAHSRECIDEAGEVQGWKPTAEDYAKCGPSAPTPPTKAADSVLEDAARLDWLALAGPTSICLVIDRPHDGEVEVSTDDVTGYGKTLREALDAARKQGGA